MPTTGPEQGTTGGLKEHRSTEDLATRADVLIEALPYLQRFRDALIVVKYGGAAMVTDELADSWARDVVLLEHVGLRPLIVHVWGAGR